MTDATWLRAKQVFHEALDKSGPEQRRFVAAACGADKELRAQVEGLLAAHSKAGDFLASPTGPEPSEAAKAAAEVVAAGSPEAPGARIGPYKLLQAIGEGGFGVVYLAEQEQPIRRRVALKIIKLGMDTKEVIARFEAERQALALMDHPNIAKVFDAGATDSGRPYFVMELVKGVSITEYSDENKLSTQERLELFVDVCKAVHHAHEKGIIHRDIKPSNVLVTLHDGTPVPKVIDFGIAKAMNQPLTEKTLFTAFGEFVGTPWCMSPEQAAMSGLEIDRRCDVYALGVLLYELLTGTTPFEAEAVRSRTFFEIMRVIREEDPPTPSARLDTLGKRLAEVATRRRAEPQVLAKTVRGDLDWIVMKAMEKDRRRRYDSAVDLADDLLRYFRHEPVIARKPSAAYRIRKFTRRRRRPLLVAAGITVAVVAGGAVGRIQGVATITKPGPPSLRLVHDSKTDSSVGTFTRDGRHRLRYSQSRRGYEYVEIASGKTRHLIPVRPDIAAGLARMNLSPDGRMLAIVSGGAFADTNAAELRLFTVGGDENGRPIYRWKPGVIGVRVFGWSPDQNRVWVYSARPDEESRADVESIDLRTGSLDVLRTFENRAYFRPPSLSPDGRYITWHAVDSSGRMLHDPDAGATDIFLLSTDGKQEVRVSHPAQDETPMFVPDGSGVVFRSSRPGGDLWFLPVAAGRPSGEPRAVWRDLGPEDRTALGYFAANGSLMYNSWGAGLGWEVYTADIDLERGVVGQPQPVQPEQVEIRDAALRAAINAPAFSPDGRYLAFLRSGKREGGFRLVLRAASSVHEREFPLAHLIHGETIDFCPDGQAVIIAGADNGGAAVFRVNLTTGAAERLPINPQSQAPALCIANNDLLYVAPHQVGQPIRLVHRYAADGTERVAYTSIVYPDFRPWLQLYGSADGSRIAILTQPFGFPWGIIRRDGSKLVVLSVAGGELLEVPGSWTAIHGIMWLPNGRELLVARESEGESEETSPEITFWRAPVNGESAVESGRMRVPAMNAQWGSEYYSLHPSGSRIVFEAMGDGPGTQLWAIDNMLAFIKSGASVAPRTVR